MSYDQWPPGPSLHDPFSDPQCAAEWQRPPPRPEIAPHLPTQAELLRICLDFAPAGGNDYPGRVLGPWADQLRAAEPTERRLLQWSVAVGCFVAPDEHPRNPFQQWATREPVPSREERQSVRAIAQTPWGFYRAGEEGWQSMIEGLPSGSFPSVEPLPFWGTHAWLAKVVPTQSGPVAMFALGFDRLPSSALLQTWIQRLPGGDYGPTWRLAMEGHRWVRQIVEWRWSLDVETEREVGKEPIQPGLS